MTLCPILWADGFGSQTLAGYGNAAFGASFSAGGGRGGRNALQVESPGYLSWSNGAHYNRFIASVAFKDYANLIVASNTDGGVILAQLVRSGTSLVLKDGANAVLWLSGGHDFSTYTQASLGVYYTGSGTMDVVLILNGASTVFSGSGTPFATGAAPLGAFLGSSSSTLTATYSDLVVQGSATEADTSLGDVACGWITGSGAGTSSAWSVTGAASDWQATNESPPDGDTSFISSSTASQKDSMAMTNLAAAAVTVYAVVPKLYARKTDAGARTIEPLFHIGGTDYAGTAQGMGTGYSQLYQVYSVSPATSSAWTVSEVNGLELGVELAT